MVLVAVAGGTSLTLGRTIVSALFAAGHEVIILSRVPPNLSTAPKEAYKALIRYVSYDDVDIIISTLKGVHTVISVLKIPSEELTESVHLNLLRASLATGTVKRFVPSDFSMFPLSHRQVAMLAHKASILKQCQDLTSSNPDFEVGQFENGMFMNYLGQKSPSSSATANLNHNDPVLAGLDDDFMLEYIDISNGVLLIPTRPDGAPAKISMTHIDDIGRYVAAAVSLPPGKWPKSGVMKIAGTTVTFERVRDILEIDCGKRIALATVTVEDCDQKKAEHDAVLKKNGFDLAAFKGGMVAEMVRVSCLGEKGGSWEDDELGKLCPEVAKGTWDLRAYMIKAWGSR